LQSSELKEPSINPINNSLDIEKKGETNNEVINFSEERDELLNKHHLLIFSPFDMQSLSKEDRAEIKSIFRSEFYFLKVLKEYRNQVNG